MPTPVPLELQALDALAIRLTTALLQNTDPATPLLVTVKNAMSYGIHIGLQLAAHDPQLAESLRERVEQHAIRSGFATDLQIAQSFANIAAIYRQLVRDYYAETLAKLN